MRCLAFRTVVAIAVLMPLAAGAVQALAADGEARLKQAAEHFADLEDAEAKAILKALSAAGVADADVLLGYLYSDPLYEGRDYQAAVGAFERAAMAGSEEGVFQLAEARFWPDYSDWQLTADENAIRPSAKEVYGLLQRTAGEKEPPSDGHNAVKWRLAWLCTFGGYDCGEETTDRAVRAASRITFDNLRAITNVFEMMVIRKSGDADTPENVKLLETHLALGYSVADPFVAGITTDATWHDVRDVGDCPDPDFIGAAGRLLALRSNAATHYEDRLDFADCYDDAQAAEIERKLGVILDEVARTFSREESWSTGWCYSNHEWPAIGQCLITTVRDHYFVCTKLSMPAYFKRFGIEYRTSKRYEQCRTQRAGRERQ